MKTITITDRAQIEDIIRKCPYCTVGITDGEGNPYVVPMNFAWENDTVYLHSGHELVYMHKQIACSYSMKSRSVICKGKVRFIEDMDEKRRILDVLMKQYTDNACNYAEPAVRNVKIWEVKVDEISCKSFGLRPSEVK